MVASSSTKLSAQTPRSLGPSSAATPKTNNRKQQQIIHQGTEQTFFRSHQHQRQRQRQNKHHPKGERGGALQPSTHRVNNCQENNFGQAAKGKNQEPSKLQARSSYSSSSSEHIQKSSCNTIMATSVASGTNPTDVHSSTSVLETTPNTATNTNTAREVEDNSTSSNTNNKKKSKPSFQEQYLEQWRFEHHNLGAQAAPKLVGAAETMSTHFTFALNKVQQFILAAQDEQKRRVFSSATSESFASSYATSEEDEDDNDNDYPTRGRRLRTASDASSRFSSSLYNASMTTTPSSVTESSYNASSAAASSSSAIEQQQQPPQQQQDDLEQISPMMRMRHQEAQQAVEMLTEAGENTEISTRNGKKKKKGKHPHHDGKKKHIAKTEEEVKAQKQRSWRRKMMLAQQQRQQESQTLLEFTEEDIEDTSTISGGGRSKTYIGCQPGGPLADFLWSLGGKDIGSKMSSKNPTALFQRIVNARCGADLDRVSSSDLDEDNDDDSSVSSASSEGGKRRTRRRGRSRRRRGSRSPNSSSRGSVSATSTFATDRLPTEEETSRTESSVPESLKEEEKKESSTVASIASIKQSNLKTSSFNRNADGDSTVSNFSISALSVTPKGPTLSSSASSVLSKASSTKKHGTGIAASMKSVSFDESTISKPTAPVKERKVSITDINKADPNFIRNFVDILATHGVPLLWHRSPTKPGSNASRPESITAYLKLQQSTSSMAGEDEFVSNATTSLPSWNSPRLVWHSNHGNDQAKELGNIELFDIASMETAAKSSPAFLQVLQQFPFSMPSRTFAFNLNPCSPSAAKTNSEAGLYVLEATSDGATQTFVHGMKWMVARLSYNLIIGNVTVSCELLPYDFFEGVKDDDSMVPQHPPGMQRANVMNDITSHMVDKTLEKSTWFIQEQQQRNKMPQLT